MTLNVAMCDSGTGAAVVVELGERLIEDEIVDVA